MKKNRQLIFGFHSIKSGIRANPSNIQEIYIDKTRKDTRMSELLLMIKENNINFHLYDKERLNSLIPNAKHQGVIASISKVQMKYVTIEDLVDVDHKDELLFLVLDGVEDPHNLGACFRVADALGVSAIISPKDNAVGVNATVRKVSCGAADNVPFVKVTNLVRTINFLKENNIFVIGTDDSVEKTIYQEKFSGAIALVMGSEGKGIRRLTRESCDFLVSIPMMGSIESLNVSVATGICLSEIQRQKIFNKNLNNNN